MSADHNYVLGQSERAASRLELQDRHFAAPSEALLDALAIRPNERVVELGCGPGGFTRRVLGRLSVDGRLVAVDASAELLEQAERSVVGVNLGRATFVRADVSKPGAWLDNADVVLGRAVLHHVPMAEFLLGKLKVTLKPGTRIGFLEPDFRRPLTHLAHEHAARPELAPLLTFAKMINDLYSAWRISSAVGASLAHTLSDAGYADVRHRWHPFDSDDSVLANMGMIYDEVRATLISLGLFTSAEIDEQQKLLAALKPGDLPPVWGLHQVTAVV